MRNLLFWGMVVCVVVSFVSCKSSESAYKKAYEKAKQQELIEPDTKVNETIEVTAPIIEATPVVPAVPVVKPEPKEEPPTASNEPVRDEVVTVITGADSNLKKYGVICGSFGLKANAEALKDFLEIEGYDPVIVFNEKAIMYRVVVVSYSDKESAVAARNSFKARYPSRKDFQGSWILNRLQ